MKELLAVAVMHDLFDDMYLVLLKLLLFQLLHSPLSFSSMINGVTEDIIEKIAGKKLPEIVELK